MKYNIVVTSITKYLRAMSIDRFLEKRNFDTCMPFYNETLLCNEKCIQILYSVLNTNSIKPSTVLKWISKLNCNFYIQEIFKICFKVTDDASVQWLQFRILHRFLPVSYYLTIN